MSAFATLADLAGCGITDSNIKMMFPRVITAQWATIRAGTQLDPYNPDAYLNEMDAITTAPTNQPLEMALQSNLAPLRENQFIIERFEYFAFDKTGEMLPNWQPNYFKPSLVINEEELIGGTGTQDGSVPLIQTNVGLPLPYCLGFEAPFNPLQSIKVDARLQRKDGLGVLRNVPVIAIGTFRYRL